jgi:hypothetical protein
VAENVKKLWRLRMACPFGRIAFQVDAHQENAAHLCRLPLAGGRLGGGKTVGLCQQSVGHHMPRPGGIGFADGFMTEAR